MLTFGSFTHASFPGRAGGSGGGPVVLEAGWERVRAGTSLPRRPASIRRVFCWKFDGE